MMPRGDPGRAGVEPTPEAELDWTQHVHFPLA
jgi:hypothetical protein